jgi:hypothetical protein
VPIEHVKRLRDTLVDSPFIIGAKYYDVIDRDPHYCLYAMLAGIHTEEWRYKTPSEKIRAAWEYAKNNGSLVEDRTSTKLLSIENFIIDRAALRKKPLLTGPEICDIVSECNKLIKD